MAQSQLDTHYLFSELDPDQKQIMEQTMRHIELDDGEVLFEMGQPARRFFLVHSGIIKLQRTSPHGGEKVINVMRAGQSFAEALMFHQRPAYPVTAISVGETELFSFDNEKFLQILGESVETCFRLMGHMSMRLHQFVQELDNLSLQNAATRFTSYLLRNLPAEALHNAELELDMPKHVIASHLSIKPETLSRILNSLVQQGLISVNGRRVRIPDVGALRASIESGIE